ALPMRLHRLYPEIDLALLRSWVSELNADLFACRLLGLSYFCCLVYFSMFFVTTNLRRPVIPLYSTRATHPPPEIRIRLMATELDSLRTSESQPLREVFERLLQFYNCRKQLDSINDPFEPQDHGRDLLPDPCTEALWTGIKEIQVQRYKNLAVQQDD